jgi:hypothetical protein
VDTVAVFGPAVGVSREKDTRKRSEHVRLSDNRQGGRTVCSPCVSQILAYSTRSIAYVTVFLISNPPRGPVVRPEYAIRDGRDQSAKAMRECRDMRQLAAYNSTRYSHDHLCTVITPNIATVVITKVRTIHAKTIHGPPPALKISSFSRRPELDRVRRPELNEVSGSSSESSMSSNSSSELSITCALCLPAAAEWRRGTMKTAFYNHMSSLKFRHQKRELRQTKKRNPSSFNGRVPLLEEFTTDL